MDNKRKSNIITIIGVALLAMGICIFGATFLSNVFGSDNSTNSTPSTQESSLPEKTTWKTKILFSIPANISGGTKEVDVTELVPFYNDAFGGDNVKCFKDRNNPYLFKITVASPDGENVDKYEEHLLNDSTYTYACDDYFNDIITKGYAFSGDGFRLLVTPMHANFVDNIFVRYIPDGENWPNEILYNGFANEAYSMIPGMSLEEIPTLNPIVDSKISFQYKTTDSELLLYKQTLGYFGYEDNNGVFTNTLNNSVMVDMSEENIISITAPIK